MITAKEFKRIRKELKLSQAKLATELGLSENSRSFVTFIESGKLQPSAHLVRTLELYYKNIELNKTLEDIKKQRKRLKEKLEQLKEELKELTTENH